MTDQVSIDVEASAEEAFALFQDYPSRLEWDPFLCQAELLGTEQPAVGVVARCAMRPAWLGLSRQRLLARLIEPILLRWFRWETWRRLEAFRTVLQRGKV